MLMVYDETLPFVLICDLGEVDRHISHSSRQGRCQRASYQLQRDEFLRRNFHGNKKYNHNQFQCLHSTFCMSFYLKAQVSITQCWIELVNNKWRRIKWEIQIFGKCALFAHLSQYLWGDEISVFLYWFLLPQLPRKLWLIETAMLRICLGNEFWFIVSIEWCIYI